MGARRQPIHLPGRQVLGLAARMTLGTAWLATGPVRLGAALAVRGLGAAMSALQDVATPAPVLVRDSRGGALLTAVERWLESRLRPVIRIVVEAALTELDLTKIVLAHVDLDLVAGELDVGAVIERVDLDDVVASVDLDRAVERVNLDRIIDRVDVGRVIEKVDLNAIVARVDVEAIVNRLDLDAIVARVDLEAIVNQLDLDAIVARVDLAAVVNRLDLDAIVSQVDLDAVVGRLDLDEIVARVDVEAIVNRLDLVGIADRVVKGIDLSGIIRDSTGSLASEAISGVRVQGQHADDAVGNLVGRLLGRRAVLDGQPSQ